MPCSQRGIFLSDTSSDRASRQPTLLRLWAYFGNEDLWYELLKRGESDNTGWLHSITKNRIVFDRAMRLLCSHGLVDADSTMRGRGAQSRGYSVHGCIHSWMIYVLNPEMDLEMARLAICCIAKHVPDKTEREYWWVQRRLLQHASRGIEMVKEGLCLEEER